MTNARQDRRHPISIVSCLVLAFHLLPLATFAQDPGKPGGGTGGSGQGKAGKLEFELSPEMLEKADKQATTPDGAVQRLKRDLGRYPSAASKQAIAELVSLGQDAVPPLRALLDGTDAKARVGAALALAGLKDTASAAKIASLVADPRLADHADAVLEAAYSLSIDDAERAALAGAVDRNGAIRRAALSALASRARAETIPGLRALLKSEHEKTRLDAFAILERLDAPGLEIEAMRLLGDLSSALSAKVCEWLVRHRNDAIVAELIGLAKNDPPNRKDLWAVLAIAQIEERFAATILRDDQLEVFTNRLRSLDPLVRLSSAIALSHLASRSQAENAEELLSGQVVPAMVETFLRGDYFKDALPLLEMCSTRLERLTGVDVGTDLTRWREAWLGGGATPRIRRDLDPAAILGSVDELIVTYERKGVDSSGEDRRLVFASSSLLGSALEGDAAGAAFVDPTTLSEFVGLVESTGVLKGRPASARAVSKNAYRSLSLRAGNRERVVAIGAESDASFEAIEARLFALADREYWQRLYHGPKEEFGAWFERQARAFGPDSRPEDRAQRLFAAIAFAIPRLDSAARCEALGVLLRDDFAVSQLTLADVKVLIGALDGEIVVEGPITLLCRIVAARGDAEAESLLIESLGAKFGLDAVPQVRDLTLRSGRAGEALASSSVGVRLGALAAIARGAPAPLASVVAAISDPDARVRREAVIALAAFDDPAARARLAEIVGDVNAPLHRVALEAIGLSSSSDAAALLEAVAAGPDLAAAAAAMRGLARRPGGAGAGSLVRHAVNPVAEPERRSAALDALAGMTDAAATEALREALRSAPEPERPAIAYLLAARFDVTAAPVLIGMLERDPTATRARDCLEMILCCDGGDRGEFFTQRWNGSPERSGDDWFAAALDPSGLERGGVPTTRALVAALRDPRWYVRHGATVRLSARLAAEIVSPGRFATQEQIEVVSLRLANLAHARMHGG